MSVPSEDEDDDDAGIPKTRPKTKTAKTPRAIDVPMIVFLLGTHVLWVLSLQFDEKIAAEKWVACE